MSSSVVIRDAVAADLAAINAIYNHYVLNSTCTYQIEPEREEARAAWFAGRGALHPVLVAEEAGVVLGWGSLSPFHRREAFAGTAENSVYVHHGHHRRGLGSLLLAELLQRGRDQGLHTIVAAISAEQAGSIALHLRHGFRETGRLFEAGRKFGQWLDVVYLQYFPGKAERAEG